MNSEQNKDERSFNQLTPRKWTSLSRSVWNDVSSPRKAYHLKHGATFSEALAERVIKMYSKEDDIVLDPFLGVGTTLVAAKKLNRQGFGIEIYDYFVEIAKEVLSQRTLTEKYSPKVINDDSRNVLKYVKEGSVQLIFTSPPYANFIHQSIEDRKKTHKDSILVNENLSAVKPYGEDERDFGNLLYTEFLIEIKALLSKLYKVTKPGGYNIWVVKDHRNTKQGIPLIPFHSDLAKTGEEVGFKWHDLIIWDQNEQRRLVLLGYPSTFYVNINHSYLVVMRKPKE